MQDAERPGEPEDSMSAEEIRQVQASYGAVVHKSWWHSIRNVVRSFLVDQHATLYLHRMLSNGVFVYDASFRVRRTSSCRLHVFGDVAIQKHRST